MWPFNREWPPNGGLLNRGSTVVSFSIYVRKESWSIPLMARYLIALQFIVFVVEEIYSQCF